MTNVWFNSQLTERFVRSALIWIAVLGGGRKVGKTTMGLTCGKAGEITLRCVSQVSEKCNEGKNSYEVNV